MGRPQTDQTDDQPQEYDFQPQEYQYEPTALDHTTQAFEIHYHDESTQQDSYQSQFTDIYANDTQDYQQTPQQLDAQQPQQGQQYPTQLPQGYGLAQPGQQNSTQPPQPNQGYGPAQPAQFPPQSGPNNPAFPSQGPQAIPSRPAQPNLGYGHTQPQFPIQSGPNNLAYPPQGPQTIPSRPVQHPSQSQNQAPAYPPPSPQMIPTQPVQYTPPNPQINSFYEGGLYQRLQQPSTGNYPPQLTPQPFPPQTGQQACVQNAYEAPQPQAVSLAPQSSPYKTAPGIPVAQYNEVWTTGLFDCMDDPMNAITTACCPCMTFGQIAEIIDNGQTSCGTSGMLYGLVAACIALPCIMSCGYRTKLRSKYGLVEAPAPDWITHFFCEWCALCQEYRELQRRGMDPAIGWQGNMVKQGMQNPQVAMMPPVNQKMMP